MNYIVHTPDYSGLSGGIRALHKLADELQTRNQNVAIESLGQPPWRLSKCPYDLQLSSEWSEAQRADAIHIYPDYCGIDPVHASRSVQWLLGPRRFATSDPEFVWSPENDSSLPRLMVDIIEPEFFYPKTKPGNFIVWWQGNCAAKGTGSFDKGIEITTEWPETRQQLGDVLRDAELLISFDSNSSLVLEAAVCGTPVEFIGCEPANSLFTRPYDEVRTEIARDVDRFIELTQSHFGGANDLYPDEPFMHAR